MFQQAPLDCSGYVDGFPQSKRRWQVAAGGPPEFSARAAARNRGRPVFNAPREAAFATTNVFRRRTDDDDDDDDDDDTRAGYSRARVSRWQLNMKKRGVYFDGRFRRDGTLKVS